MAEQKKRRRAKRVIKTGLPDGRSELDIALQSQFEQVAEIVRRGRYKAFAEVNSAVIDTYWKVGEYISLKVRKAEWGEGVVQNLADYLLRTLQDPRGFSAKNLWRMRQFVDFYSGCEKLSPLVRQLSWTHNLMILSRAKSIEEKQFYLTLAIREQYSKRELEQRFDSRLFERTVSAPPKLSPPVRVLHPGAEHVFRDSYSLGFLGLPDDHSESDLRQAIVRNLKQFIIEFGRDFAFVGEHYRLQVGTKDFFVDLLFYHRELRCLVAFELKIEEFKPDHLGQLSFYLEALDRDVKKLHENPSIGVILCKGKESEVVEYALSRTTSPAAIADYWTKLPDRGLLQNKLHELFDSSLREVQAKYGD